MLSILVVPPALVNTFDADVPDSSKYTYPSYPPCNGVSVLPIKSESQQDAFIPTRSAYSYPSLPVFEFTFTTEMIAFADASVF